MHSCSVLANRFHSAVFRGLLTDAVGCHAQIDILFCYFGIRKFATHWVSLGFFCMLVPLSTFTPEVWRRHALKPL